MGGPVEAVCKEMLRCCARERGAVLTLSDFDSGLSAVVWAAGLALGGEVTPCIRKNRTVRL
jgi:hypothetical protein